MDSRLSRGERVAVFLPFLLFGCLVVLAQGTKVAPPEWVEPVSFQEIAIEVRGSVKEPGVYSCLPGTTVGELLKKAGLARDAERKGLAMKRLLMVEQTIEVPQKGSRGKKSL